MVDGQLGITLVIPSYEAAVVQEEDPGRNMAGS